MLEKHSYQEKPRDKPDLSGLLHLIEEKTPDKIEDHLDVFEKSGLYQPGEPTRDFAKAKNEALKKQEKNSPEAHESWIMAKVFEMATAGSIDRFGWLGDTVYAQPTSLYDDQKGVDTVIEYTKPFQATRSTPHYAGFGIDLTYSQWFGQKTTKIKDAILYQGLPEIKYFISGMDGQPKRIIDVPLLVITASPATILDLGQLWAETYSSDTSVRRTAREKLTSHWYRDQLINSLADQSKIIRDFALKNNKHLAADSYDNVHQLVITLPGYNSSTERDDSFAHTKNHFQFVFNQEKEKPRR